MMRTGSLWWSAPATASRFSASSLPYSLVVPCKEPRRKESRRIWGAVRLWSVRDSDHHPPTDLPDWVRLVADLAHLCVAQGCGRAKPWLRLTPHRPTTLQTLHDAHDLQERRGVGRLPLLLSRTTSD